MKIILFALALCVAVAQAKDWAVIVAGSTTFANYRHQADACHAYQVVSKYGIPDERIIMMYYDDIANNPENPFPGQIFNAPTSGPGVDVYAGCKKDYTGEDVNPKNFLAVLQGNSSHTGGKPVLQSTSEDNVFINFVDHGGPGIIAFPYEVLQANDLNAALVNMHSKGMYKKLVFYMEACESGSMFENILPTNLEIYATTAANADESSWGTYCPPNDVVNGKSINSCLGDLYSVNWMQDADKVGPNQTLSQQFAIVKQETDKSHVQQFGDLTWLSEPIGAFMGQMGEQVAVVDKNNADDVAKPSSNVNSRDIPLHLAYWKYLRADKTDLEAVQAAADALHKEINDRVAADQLFMKLASSVAESNEHATSLFSDATENAALCMGCCKIFHDAVAQCGGYTDYSIQHARVAVNICKTLNQNEEAAAEIAQQFVKMC